MILISYFERWTEKEKNRKAEKGHTLNRQENKSTDNQYHIRNLFLNLTSAFHLHSELDTTFFLTSLQSLASDWLIFELCSLPADQVCLISDWLHHFLTALFKFYAVHAELCFSRNGCNLKHK